MNVSLVLTPDLPASDEIERWFAEPVRSLTIPTSLFMTNKSGFPVLPRPHQLFVKRFFQVV
jgi:protein arginine N-methyltransferase 5